MAIEELVAVVAPPATPVDVGPIERRKQVEAELGIVLPDDLFEIAMVYGTGYFPGGIRVFNPFSDRYFEYVKMTTDCYRELKQAEGDECVPYDIFPTMPGFLPWGDSWGGCEFFWLAKGEPNEWPVVLVVGRQPDVYEGMPMQMTTFLAKAFSEPLPCVLWDVEWQTENLIGKSFEPMRSAAT